MGRTLPPASQLVLQQVDEIKPLYDALRRSDQLILDRIFEEIGPHRAAIANAANLLPLESMLLLVSARTAQDIDSARLLNSIERSKFSNLSHEGIHRLAVRFVHNPKHGITVWLLSEDGKSHSFTQEFSITFYVAGPFHRLRQLWKYLKEKPVVLSRTERDDLYSGKKDVLELRVPNPVAFEELFKEVNHQFPDLSYYDVDIPLILRYAAAFHVFPLANCKVEVEQGWEISNISALDMPWELDPKLPNLRILYLRPDVNPAHANTTISIG